MKSSEYSVQKGLLVALALSLVGCGDAAPGNSGGVSGAGGSAGASSGGSSGSAGSGGTALPPPNPGDEASANGNCNDGQDNDSDGFTDLEDVGCFNDIVTSGAEARYHELCGGDADIMGCGSGGRGTGSEPLQNDDFPTWETPATASWNPSDSPQVTSLGGDSSFGDNHHDVDNSNQIITRPWTVLPDSAKPGVRGVAVQSNHIANIYTENICNNAVDPARVCFRYYRAYTNVPEVDCNFKTLFTYNDINKAWTIEGVTGAWVQGANSKTGTSFGDVDPDTCDAAGCRIEVCFSNPCESDVTTEAWMTDLNTGIEHPWFDNPMSSGAGGGPILEIHNNMWGNCVADGDFEHENSYVMRADWSVDRGQRIGPAYEMEGQ